MKSVTNLYSEVEKKKKKKKKKTGTGFEPLTSDYEAALLSTRPLPTKLLYSLKFSV